MNQNKENDNEIYCCYCGKHLPLGTDCHIKEENNEIVDIMCEHCYLEILKNGLEYIQNMDVLDFLSYKQNIRKFKIKNVCHWDT